jgi:hypothetical protein
MAITLKRQLDDGEKQIILKRHGRICFATGHPIPEGDRSNSTTFVPLRPSPRRLSTTLPLCAKCTTSKKVHSRSRTSVSVCD